jgi:hypothetical protein
MQLCSDTPAAVLDVGNSNVSWSAKTPTRAAQNHGSLSFVAFLESPAINMVASFFCLP